MDDFSETLPVQVNGYRFTRIINKTPRATVYKAVSLKSEDLYSAWVLEPTFLCDLPVLDHPNILKLYDRFTFENHFVVITEYVAGSLREYMRKRTVSYLERLEIAKKIIDAVSFLEANHITNEALTVDSIGMDLYDDPKLYDFSAARFGEGEDVTPIISELFGDSLVVKRITHDKRIAVIDAEITRLIVMERKKITPRRIFLPRIDCSKIKYLQ